MTARSLEQILRLVRDGQWHDIDEVTERIHLSELKTQIITEFLANYGFIELDRKNRKIRISHSLAKFLRMISSVEPKKVC